MGVHGLTSWVRPEHSAPVLPSPSTHTLIIDGDSLLHFLIHVSSPNIPHNSLYSHIHRTLKSFLLTLAQQYKWNVVLVIDGLKPAPKLPAHITRYLDTVTSNSSLPIPRFTTLCLIQTAREIGIPLHVAPGEGDSLCFSIAYQLGLECAGVIALDSDYLIFPDISYIPLPSLVFQKDHITAAVYSSKKIADTAEVQPQYLPLIASLAGNDWMHGVNDLLHSLQSNVIRKQSSKRKRHLDAIFALFNKSNTLPWTLENEQNLLRSILQKFGPKDQVSQKKLMDTIMTSVQRYRSIEDEAAMKLLKTSLSEKNVQRFLCGDIITLEVARIAASHIHYEDPLWIMCNCKIPKYFAQFRRRLYSIVAPKCEICEISAVIKIKKKKKLPCITMKEVHSFKFDILDDEFLETEENRIRSFKSLLFDGMSLSVDFSDKSRLFKECIISLFRNLALDNGIENERATQFLDNSFGVYETKEEEEIVLIKENEHVFMYVLFTECMSAVLSAMQVCGLERCVEKIWNL